MERIFEKKSSIAFLPVSLWTFGLNSSDNNDASPTVDDFPWYIGSNICKSVGSSSEEIVGDAALLDNSGGAKEKRLICGDVICKSSKLMVCIENTGANIDRR